MTTIPVILPHNVHMTVPDKRVALNLAATQIVFGKHKDDQGREKQGWTAALSIMIGDDRRTMKAFKVHTGKKVQFDRFTVEVKRIESSRFGMVVFADVTVHE